MSTSYKLPQQINQAHGARLLRIVVPIMSNLSAFYSNVVPFLLMYYCVVLSGDWPVTRKPSQTHSALSRCAIVVSRNRFATVWAVGLIVLTLREQVDDMFDIFVV